MARRQPIFTRSIHPLTALGLLLVAVASTALLTYTLLIATTRQAARAGPPGEFLAAATRQAQLAGMPQQTASPLTGTASDAALSSPAQAQPTPTLLVAIPSETEELPPAAPLQDQEASLPEWVVVKYWISIPAIDVEAPVMPLDLREREVEGVKVQRLAVPDGYVVGWDQTSAEPGSTGNVIMTGHNNLWGAVFGNLEKLEPGDEIAIWGEHGVFSYFVSEVLILEEEGQPIEVRLANAQWISQTTDSRLTLVTCWPRRGNSHRLVVVAFP